MRSLRICGSIGTSEVDVGGSLRDLRKRLGGERAFVITDPNLRRLWGPLLEGFEVLEMGTGEGSKTLATAQLLYRSLLEREADRRSWLVGVGGGIVCDVTGFVASTYLRGLPFGFVASTLLAQVDASVGGKNGVNLDGFKNLVGTFRQPRFVLCDLELLSTLPARELRCGLAELIKAAAVARPSLFAFLEERAGDVLALEPASLERAVLEAVEIKAGIVAADETEQGQRRKLNFGHTLGHAIEATRQLPHGEAVSIGMAVASDLSVRLGLLPAQEARRLEQLLERVGLPTRAELDRDAVLAAMAVDKKRAGDEVHLVLLQGQLGNAVVRPVPIKELEALLP
jgi:3-dehydroquinate synthase